ncbi:MAG: arginine deiminase-related protein [Deltaproteobacteria bacterium]|nr:arginine deiminase-related protein [Deltaproteobacteria bacterium]
MNHILLSPPDFYTVDYEINPWMHVREKPDSALAVEQWNGFYDCLKTLGLKIETISPAEGLPDMVFTANGGLVYGNKFIVSNFRHKERQNESDLFENWFRERGYEIIKLPKSHFFEGEGDAFILGDTLVAGFKFRSHIQSHKFIGEVLKKRVLSLELIQPEFYHLDTCFCPLDDKSALYYPDAFDDYGVKALAHLIPDLIAVNSDDALNFCCNAVVRGHNIIMNNCSRELKTHLSERGYNLHLFDFSEYIKAGGSAKCLTLWLDRYGTKG